MYKTLKTQYGNAILKYIHCTVINKKKETHLKEIIKTKIELCYDLYFERLYFERHEGMLQRHFLLLGRGQS